MSAAEIARLESERDMAKALLLSAESRLEQALRQAKKKPSKFNTPNRFITKQLKKAS